MQFTVREIKNRMARFLSLTLSICILFVLLVSPTPASFASNGDELVDIKAHWAVAVIREWVSQGLIKGYGNGRFGPNDSISRAEFVTLLNRIFCYTQKSNTSFADVKKDAWYAGEIAKAYQSGVIKGDSNGSIKPEAVISRQEAAVMLTRAFSLTKEYAGDALTGTNTGATLNGMDSYASPINENTGYPLKDESSGALPISENAGYALTYTNFGVSLDGKGSGTSSDNEHSGVSSSNDNISAALKYADHKQIADWALDSVGVMTKRGYISGRPSNLFAPKDNLSRSEAVKMIDNVMGELINSSGTYTKTVPGNMVVSSKDVTLKDTNIDGDLYLTDGIGQDTIRLIGVTVKGRMIISGTLSGKVIVLSGDFEEIVIESPGAIVTVESGTVDRFVVGKTAAGAVITAKDGTVIENLITYAGADIAGGKNIKSAVIASGGVTMDERPQNVIIADGGKAVSYKPGFDDTVVPGGGGPSSGGSSKPKPDPIDEDPNDEDPDDEDPNDEDPDDEDPDDEDPDDEDPDDEDPDDEDPNDEDPDDEDPDDEDPDDEDPDDEDPDDEDPDTIVPSVPRGLTCTAVSSSTISLSWTASTDNVGVAGYRIYRNGMKIGETGSTNYSDTGITMMTQVRYTVAAFDAANNVSEESAALIKSASCGYPDVNAAVASAQSGDTVIVPEGNSIWMNVLTIPNSKKITLSGSGAESTVISSDVSGPESFINIGVSGSRVTNIGFQLSDNTSNAIMVRGNDWRVDHCQFDNICSNNRSRRGIYVRGHSTDEGSPIGLVDHCTFNDIRVLVQGDGSLMANSIWAQPLGLGTNNAVFIENCVFTFKNFGNSTDAHYGGRYVSRYNVINDSYIEAHSVHGTHRATRSWEIYGNEINQLNRKMFVPMFLRAGTGVVFDNSISGSWTSGPRIAFDNVRSFSAEGEGGMADGTSPWDGNEDATGYPARDQIGRSTDAWLWTNENPYPPQEHAPVYLWNNKHNGTDVKVYIHNNCEDHIQENRDYYNGVGKLDYVPYPYPHPMTLADYPDKNMELGLTLFSNSKLRWNAITDAVSYSISKDWQEPIVISAPSVEYSISGGSVYYVKALDAQGNVLAAEGVHLTLAYN